MSQTSSTNFVLHAKSNQFYWQGDGQLSIKTFANGTAYYKNNHGFFAVEEPRYLLLNEGKYTITIEEEQNVESFCLFFKDGFAEEVAYSLENNQNTLLSDPYKHHAQVAFFEKTYHDDSFLSRLITNFKEKMPLFKNDLLWQEEQYHRIMERLIYIHHYTLGKVEAIDLVRSSTREEIYRRVSIALEFIRCYYNQPITLDQIADTAYLSKNHLLRNYSTVFGLSPHQDITKYRILQAKKLLKKLHYSMTDITFEIGYQIPVSFSKMFKQHVGLSPLQYRKKVILDKKP